MASIPRVRLEASRAVNEFYHLSVLFAELMPLELANGVLGNRKYQEERSGLKSDDVRAALELARREELSSQREWFEIARSLMRQDSSTETRKLAVRNLPGGIIRKIMSKGEAGFDELWKEAEPRLEEYRKGFEALWSPVSDRVLGRLSELAKTDWRSNEVRVHFVDCLYGGFGWCDCIGVAPVPDYEVEMKLVAHELSELITPQGIVAVQSRSAGFDPDIAHTVVDLLAYFSVNEFLPKPTVAGREKKGIKPNPEYYLAVRELFPFFERYAQNPTSYPRFGRLVEDMVSELRRVETPNAPTGPVSQ